MRFALVVGTTRTATIGGISAAGADPDLMRHTPAADAEIVAYGRPVLAPVVPVSPAGCPTPAVVTRAVRELLGFELLPLDAGLPGPTAAPTVDLADPGRDVRDAEAVPDAAEAYRSARELGRALPDDDLVVGESVPGGTTTALGTLRALGEPYGVSSSLPENPTGLKREVVAEGLAASGLSVGDAAGDPTRALRAMGDPVLAVVSGLAAGAASRGATVTLAGGTQMLAAAALLRHGGLDEPLRIATTAYVAEDREPAASRSGESTDVAGLRDAADALDVDLSVTDPGFDRSDHPAMARYVAGEAKEGVGMGGALRLASRTGTSMAEVRDRVVSVHDRLGIDSDRDPEAGRDRESEGDRGP